MTIGRTGTATPRGKTRATGKTGKKPLAGSSRDRMIEATAELLQKQGYAGTGLAEILAVSGAPRGSMYFHFPNGKEQLACEALRTSGETWKTRIAEVARGITDPGEAVAAVCTMLGDELEASAWELGCPIATVALEAAGASEAIRETCASHFEGWETIVAARLRAAGFDEATAGLAATVTVSSIEGALLLARVYRSRAPLERIAIALRAQLTATRG